MRRWGYRCIAVELGAGILALVELVTALPALVALHLGVSTQPSILLTVASAGVATWLGWTALATPRELWRDGR